MFAYSQLLFEGSMHRCILSDVFHSKLKPAEVVYVCAHMHVFLCTRSNQGHTNSCEM